MSTTEPFHIAQAQSPSPGGESVVAPGSASSLTTAPVHLPPLPLGRQEGRVAFARLVLDTLESASRHQWKEWWWSDPDFDDWPLGDRAAVDALNRWAGRGRRLHLLARDYRSMRQLHARFVSWRVKWDHIIEIKACPSASEEDFPSAIWTPDWCLERIDKVHSVVVCSDSPQRRTLLRHDLQEWWSKGSPAFSASTLGL